MRGQQNSFPFVRSFSRTRVSLFATLCAVGATASLALPALAAGAQEASASARKDPGTSAEFTVAGSNGYSLYVKSEKGTVEVIATRQRPPVETISANGRIHRSNTGNVATTTYFAPASGDPNAFEADLGTLGAIAATFQPSGETRVSRVNLKGKTTKCVGAERIVRHLGTFNGTIKFQGEGGYTAVDVSSAKGTVGTSLFRNCTTKPRRPRRHRRTSANGIHFSAVSSDDPPVFFAASTGRPCLSSGNGPCFYASTVEALPGELVVVRSVQATSADRSFVFNDALTHARLIPPGPFSGQGNFRSAPQASGWTGSLAVAFPGATVPLTGPSFAAQLSRSP
jgi:hypothetical protein